jgi:Leucine-rich repeat (LRR) protein
MIKRTNKILKKTHRVLKKHRRIGFWSFGTFTIVKTFLLFIWFFGILNIFADWWIDLNIDNITGFCPTTENTCNLSWMWITSIATGTFINHANLNYLTLDHNNIETLELWVFSWLINIYTIHINNNSIVHIDDEVFNHTPQIYNIWIADNKISTITIENLNNLIWLFLYKNDIDDLKLNNLNNLQTLSLDNNFLETIDLTSFSLLENVSINNNNLENINISWLNNLRYINLDNNYIQNIDLNWLNLEEIYLSNNQIDYLVLSGMSLLDHVNINENLLTWIILYNLPKLNRLQIKDNQLSQLDLSSITTLEQIKFWGNNLENINVNWNLWLEMLDGYNNKLTEIDLSNLTNLKSLNLSLNKLTNINFGTITGISELYIPLNYLSGSLDFLKEFQITETGSVAYNYFDVDDIDPDTEVILDEYFLEYTSYGPNDRKYQYRISNIIAEIESGSSITHGILNININYTNSGAKKSLENHIAVIVPETWVSLVDTNGWEFFDNFGWFFGWAGDPCYDQLKESSTGAYAQHLEYWISETNYGGTESMEEFVQNIILGWSELEHWRGYYFIDFAESWNLPWSDGTFASIMLYHIFGEYAKPVNSFWQCGTGWDYAYVSTWPIIWDIYPTSTWTISIDLDIDEWIHITWVSIGAKIFSYNWFNIEENDDDNMNFWFFEYSPPMEICHPGRDNQNFITKDFRNLSPSSGQIICALYGSGNEWTAYTQHRSGWDGSQCSGFDINVIHTGNLPATFTENTIYVLTWEQVIVPSTRNLANCSAVVSENISGTNLYSSSQLWWADPMIKSVNNSYTILDNINIDGRNNGSWGVHSKNIYGIYADIFKNNTLNNIQAFNNASHWIIFMNSSNNHLKNIQLYNNTFFGVYLRTSSNNILNNIHSYNNTSHGIILSNSSNNNTLNNIQSYNNANHGIYLSKSSNNSLQNIQLYSNAFYGMWLYDWSNNNQLNNAQVYNNGNYGIILTNSSNNNTLNNIQSYNNTDMGIHLSKSSNNVINNVNLYNNGKHWIYLINGSVNNILHEVYTYNNLWSLYIDTSSTGNKYFGDNMFENISWYSLWIETWYSDFYYLSRNSGNKINRRISRDYITNPINIYWDYMLSWSWWLFTDIIWAQSYTPTTDKYSYGSGISLQIQPVLYSWTTLISSWSFDATKYIWSDIIKVTWDTQIVPEYTKYNQIILTGLSLDPLVNRYSVFGYINYFTIGQNINTTTWIELTSGDEIKYLITQLWEDNYFATHFQKNTFLDQTPPSQVILVSPNSWTVFNTGNISLQRQISTDTWAWLSGYIYHISTGMWFSEIVSWFTLSTWLSLTNIPNGKYYRAIYAIDNINNVWLISEVRMFSVELCGNWFLDEWEECDHGISNWNTWACSDVCTWNTPSCTLSVTPLTWYAPLTWIFTIGGVDTWWIHFDRLDFGDGSTGNVDTWNLVYEHSYINTWIYTWTLKVSNIYDPQLTGQCNASIQLFVSEYCGDGEVNNDEKCDLGENNWPNSACSILCTWNTPSCTLSVTPLTWYAPLTWIFTIGGVDTWWIHFDRLDFGDGSTGNVDTWNLVYEHRYTDTWIHTWTLQISNASNNNITGQCEVSIELFCENISRTPDPSTICSPNVFTQTSNCGDTRIATGTKNCGWWWTYLRKDDCCIWSKLPGANHECIDYSPSYYDNTCLSSYHWSAWSFCRYDDEQYIDNWPFVDTIDHRWFNYIEVLRNSCLHRWKRKDRSLWTYHPNDYVKKSELIKTFVKIRGIAFDNFQIETEDKVYPFDTIFEDLSKNNRLSWYINYAFSGWITDWLYTIKNNKKYLNYDEYLSRYETVKKLIETYNIINWWTIKLNNKTNLTDLKTTDPYYNYIRQAESLWIIVWFKQKNWTYKFEWDRNITRAEFAKIVSLSFGDLLFVE